MILVTLQIPLCDIYRTSQIWTQVNLTATHNTLHSHPVISYLLISCNILHLHSNLILFIMSLIVESLLVYLLKYSSILEPTCVTSIITLTLGESGDLLSLAQSHTLSSVKDNCAYFSLYH